MTRSARVRPGAEILTRTHTDDATATSTLVPDTRPGAYFVTIMRGARVGLLLGPFVDDHETALDYVDLAREAACRRDPRAHWDAFGTSRVPDRETELRGVLNEEFGLPA